MISLSSSVSVIVPAHNAERTIAMAVGSALREPEVTEVIVVEDASTDSTAATAARAAAGDPRFIMLRQEKNIGPAQARNIAIAHSSGDMVALLDADDYFLPGRFAAMLHLSGHEIIADNVAFVPETRCVPLDRASVDRPENNRPREITLSDFLLGNVPSRSVSRGELGFLKPVMSRAFLRRHGLTYDAHLRLGEDFVLYVEALLAGAHYMLLPDVGYVARVRPNSLSGQHSVDDLRNLYQASLKLSDKSGPDAEVQRAMQAYLRSLRDRVLLREFLEVKADCGLAQAAWQSFKPLSHVVPILKGVMRDKMAALSGEASRPVPMVRYLLPLR